MAYFLIIIPVAFEALEEDYNICDWKSQFLFHSKNSRIPLFLRGKNAKGANSASNIFFMIYNLRITKFILNN